jgi:hypothetical protein
MGPFDTVLRLTRNGGKCTQRYGGARSMHVQLTLNATCDGGKNDPRLASEPLGAAVDQGLQAVKVVTVDHADQSSVDPSSCFNAVEPTDNKVELHIVILVLVLNLAAVWCNLDSFDAALDEACSHIGFV